MADGHLINAYCLLDKDPTDVRNAIKPAIKVELVKRGLVYIPPMEAQDEPDERCFD